MSLSNDAIQVIGAGVHNLKHIDVSIPLNTLAVVTGVSGSGKSSFAFDTLYSEGQRRYVASLSAYARQFLERIARPEVDDILGICPALAIRQKNYSRNPRSTVGTVTEINDYLRLLYARIGRTFCRGCGRPVEKDTPERTAEFVMALPEGTRLYVCMPVPLDSGPGPTAESRLAQILPGLQQQGFVRLLIGRRVVDLIDAVEVLRTSDSKQARVVLDRLVVKPDIRKRLIDSLETCCRESEGTIELVFPEPTDCTEKLLETEYRHIRWVRHPAGILAEFSERFECQLCHILYEEPEPRLFSFNNPFGACPDCQGFGNTMTLDMDLVVPDKSKTLAEGAIHPWTKPRYKAFQTRLLNYARRERIPDDVPWNELSEADRGKIEKGRTSQFPGVLGFFEYLETKKYKMHVRIFISRYRGYATCLTCNGERLRQEARDVLISGKRIPEILRMTTAEADSFFSGIALTPYEASVADKILAEIRHRLDLLVRVGLDYIALDRLSSSLSGGESQRIQLASSLGSTLVGVLYVLDEPSIGLHPRDSRRLIEILKNLKSLGNTVVVVEHDPQIMRSADYIVDLGPWAGEHGGSVIHQGDYASLLQNSKSVTSRYLRGELRIPTPRFRRKPNGKYIEITNAREHNLKNLDIRIPLGMTVCISGVSGSGKSTLVHDVLYAAIKNAKAGSRESTEGYDRIRGSELVMDAVLVDQSPIGRTPRSNPVTYIKAFDEIRGIFAETRDAYARNFGPGHFSFNLSGGRCETCQGNGVITVEMQFLADVELVCEDCKGTRFKSSVLEVEYKGRNIAEVLDLTVHQAIEFFAGHPKLTRKLRILEEIGLGYIHLGQSATSLSGGEAQRIKLASFISRKSTGHTLFIFDEPTTGLHFDDIRKLLTALDKLIDAGNSLVVIEHNLDVIKSADWVIDLGPEGGQGGGRILFEGSPDDLVRSGDTHTAHFLKEHLSNSQ